MAEKELTQKHGRAFRKVSQGKKGPVKGTGKSKGNKEDL